MASKFTDDYRSVTDEDLERWRRHFTDEELVELGTFMALADGFGKLNRVRHGLDEKYIDTLKSFDLLTEGFVGHVSGHAPIGSQPHPQRAD